MMERRSRFRSTVNWVQRDLLDGDLSAEGELFEVRDDAESVVGGSDVGGEDHAVGVGGSLVAHGCSRLVIVVLD